MLPADLSPHLHTEECNFLIRFFQQCDREKSLFRRVVLQECVYWQIAAAHCLKEERIYRRETNPKFTRRLIENKRLPEEKYTPVLRKLKEEGKLKFDEKNSGCCEL